MRTTTRTVSCSRPGCARVAISYNGKDPVCGRHFLWPAVFRPLRPAARCAHCEFPFRPDEARFREGARLYCADCWDKRVSPSVPST